MSQLEIIAMVIKSENIESGFVRDLRIVQLLVESGLSYTDQPTVIKIMKEME